MQSSQVEISFECLPLQSLGRLGIPLDASPAFHERGQRIKDAIEKHGTCNTYYLFDAHCIFRLTNDPSCGMLRFGFEGTVITDPGDLCTRSCDLDVRLLQETCDWLTEPIVRWFSETVSVAVRVEFDRFIAEGDLSRNRVRASRAATACEETSSSLGMYL